MKEKTYRGKNLFNKTMNLDYSKAERHAFLEINLFPHSLCFHNADYTKELLKATETLTKLEKLNPHDTTLAKTAAAYLHIGYMYRNKNHEKAGAKLVGNILPNFGYNSNEIKTLQGILLSIEKFNPKTKLQKILCDADSSYLGGGDFFTQREQLKLEGRREGNKISSAKWYEGYLKSLENHKYFTKSAKKLWQKKKEENIAEMKKFMGFDEGL